MAQPHPAFVANGNQPVLLKGGSGWAEPEYACPYCNESCCADFVDIGVGMQQCGPFRCSACLATEIGSYDAKVVLTENEMITGWYEPRSNEEILAETDSPPVAHAAPTAPPDAYLPF